MEWDEQGGEGTSLVVGMVRRTAARLSVFARLEFFFGRPVLDITTLTALAHSSNLIYQAAAVVDEETNGVYKREAENAMSMTDDDDRLLNSTDSNASFHRTSPPPAHTDNPHAHFKHPQSEIIGRNLPGKKSHTSLTYFRGEYIQQWEFFKVNTSTFQQVFDATLEGGARNRSTYHIRIDECTV
jgi:hypothetical protein